MMKKPKICVPITGKTKQEIMDQAEEIKKNKVELAEWRADYFDEVSSMEKIFEILRILKDDILIEKEGAAELIFTLRTGAEGGRPVSGDISYREVLSEVISQGKADYIDIEVFREDESIESLFQLAKNMNMKTIGSYHNFERTPQSDELVHKMKTIKDMGASIGKIAVMPQSEEDVEVLLEAAGKIKEDIPKFPIIMISMGELGKESRLYGGLYGSVISFGKLGTASAPGQVSVKELRKKMEPFYNGKKHVILIGFMGVGKTVVSQHIGKLTGRNVIDTDELITMTEGRSIGDIFESEGEPFFRKLETNSIDRLGNISPCVVSCGGGMVLREINIRKLRAIGTIVLLTAEPATILGRVENSGERPLLQDNLNEDYISVLMDKRKPYYEEAADLVIPTDGKLPESIAENIVRYIRT